MNADSVRALRDMMMSGSGRAVLESQILQEHSIQRLLAIVRGEELPPRPEPKAEVPSDEGAETSTDAETNAPEASASDQASDSADDDSADEGNADE